MRCLNCSREGVTTETQVCPGCGVYLPSLVRELLPPGTLLHAGKYRIEYALGRGGFGVTYVGRHVSLEQPVAVKEFFPREFAVRDSTTGRVGVSRPHEESFRRSLKRFVREGQVLALVSHPSVVRVRDQFEELDTAYLVMDLISPARTLREELDARAGRRLPLEVAQKITGELVEALEAVHRAGVYHLDIKPDNILLTPAGRPVLVDFGASRRGLSSQSTQAFTLEYAAPEVVAGEDVGPESDIFELGMVVHEMLAGERPPSAMSRLLRGEWEPSGLEAPWAELVASAVRMRKEERPKSVAEWWGQGLSNAKAKTPRKRAAKPKPTERDAQKPATAKGQGPLTHEQQKGDTAQRKRRTKQEDKTGDAQRPADTSSPAPAGTTPPVKAPDARIVAGVEQLLRGSGMLRAVEFYHKETGEGLKASRDFVEAVDRRMRAAGAGGRAPVQPPPPRTDASALLTADRPSPPVVVPGSPPAKASGGRGRTLLFVIIIAVIAIYYVYPRIKEAADERNSSAHSSANSAASSSQLGLPVPTPETSRPSQGANYAAAPRGAAFATKYCGPSNSVVRKNPNIGEMAFAVCGCGTSVGVTGVTETLDFNTGRVLYQWAEVRYTDPSGKSVEGWMLSTSLADTNPCK